MLGIYRNTNGYRWVQNSVHCGNYICQHIILVTCLILPTWGVRRTFKVEVKKHKEKNEKEDYKYSLVCIQSADR